MAHAFSSTRRRMLVAVASISPAFQLLAKDGPDASNANGANGVSNAGTAGTASDANTDFLRVSQILTGSDKLSAEIAERLRKLLLQRQDGFASKFSELSAALSGAGSSRSELLARLTDAQVKFALSIAKPWYLGYVGTPSSFVLKDDAAFVTFLDAQSYQKIIDEVPRPTYPQGAAGWWVQPPRGVPLQAMPKEITDWTYHPGGPPDILAPDAVWKEYATGQHASIDAARKKKPGTAETVKS